MVYIYGLIDPFTSKIRYIGKTIKLQQRLSRQCSEVSNTYRSHWIQSLVAKGKKPRQVVLQVLSDDEDWQKAEIKWIAIAKKYGWNLVNCTDGGDGVTNISGEGKERMLKTWEGRSHKPETIEKLRKINKGKVKPQKSKDVMSEKMAKREIKWKDKLVIANRKFDDERLHEIKKDLDGGMLVIDAAKKYNVHRTTVSKIKAGTYKVFKQKTTNYVKPRLYHKAKD